MVSACSGSVNQAHAYGKQTGFPAYGLGHIDLVAGSGPQGLQGLSPPPETCT